MEDAPLMTVPIVSDVSASQSRAERKKGRKKKEGKKKGRHAPFFIVLKFQRMLDQTVVNDRLSFPVRGKATG